MFGAERYRAAMIFVFPSKPMRATAALLLLLLAACSDRASPDAQVRAVIERIERAVEERDVGDVLAHIAAQYRDEYGNDRETVGRALRGYFIAHQSIHLLTRIEALYFLSDDEARVAVLVAMVGRDAAATNAWDLAADLYSFDLVLVRDGAEWKVTWARWRRS
nr:hypothetical protein [Gammaproteobacteria bacterium]